MSATPKPKVVIVGAGFAGIETLRRLHALLPQGFRITLINPTNYFLFTPLLHEVATGGLFPEDVVVPLRPLVKKLGAEFVGGIVKGVDLKKKIITTDQIKIDYDYLVLAPGSTTNFYDTLGAAQYCLTLKSLNDAIGIKNRILRSFEKATLEPGDLTFIIAGGGATGVELAAELSDFIADAIKNYYPPAEILAAKIILIQKDNHLLPQFSDELRSKCLKILAAKGIQVRLNEGIAEVRADGVRLADGEFILSKTVIWTAGVKPQTIHFQPETELERDRLVVDKFLRLPSHPEVFVLGDAAAFKNNTGEPLPMLAQVAHKAGKNVAENLRRAVAGELPKPFAYHHSGSLISLGSWFAAGELGPIHVSGKFMWWVWRTVYLSKMPTWSKKFQIALDWTIDLFLPRDTSILPCEVSSLKNPKKKR